MAVFYLPIALTVLATAAYHVAQKSVPPAANPMVSLVATYITALAASLIGLALWPAAESPLRAVRQLTWASYAIGGSIVVVELAFLLAYRAGWRISLASAVANVATAVLLLVVGLALYGERLSAQQIAGIVLCLPGLLLAVRP